MRALAKKSQNPIASLISVPIQNNVNFGLGPNNDTQYINLIQPVLPQKLTEDWNWIHRGIIPVPVYQPAGKRRGWAISSMRAFSRRRIPESWSGVSGRTSTSRRQPTVSWGPESGAPVPQWSSSRRRVTG